MKNTDYTINLKKIDWQNGKKIKWKKLNVFFVLILVIISMSVFFLLTLKYIINKDIYLEKEVIINKWDTMSLLYDAMTSIDRIWFKLFIKLNNIDTSKIQEWIYQFSWVYNKQEILDNLNQWPQLSYTKVVILEWRNKYDIDEYLFNVGVAQKWQYIEAVTDKEIINYFAAKYEFLKKINPNIESLEWFLFPNTYNLDIKDNMIQELMNMQLDSFESNIWNNFSWDILQFDDKLKSYNFKIKISPYWLLVMSSIVEKEEKTNSNKAIVSWILLNKLEKENRIYADISLCYWLKMSWNECTPRVIWNNVSDSNNIYNTRKVSWIPPTPIWNPSKATINHFLNFEKTIYMYYLHDNKWQLHPSENLSEHNYKKSKYLNY